MTVRSVGLAIAILRHLARLDDPQGVNAIARAVAVAPSSAFNILKTLTGETLIRFDDRSKLYAIDPEARTLFASTHDLTSWFDGVRGHLTLLANAHLLSCGLWEVAGSRVVLREVFDSPDPTRVYLSRGQRLPSHIGAMGRCVAAHEGLSRADVLQVVGQMRWQSPPSAAAFWQDLQHVRVHGWSMDRGNYIRGLTTLAAPIRDEQGGVIFCVTGTGFDGQHDLRQLNAIGAQLASVAAQSGADRIMLLTG